MLRWLLIIVLTLLVFSGLLRPWLARLGLGRLPGDFEFRIGERRIWLPLATTVLLSFVAMLIGKLV
ncbi:DUF2905 domain-containing protein [Rivibacter subsaxonicus]|jgi:hypothetical protein|uniref:DUF2905 family protein n=1 Tax=Rivibacter subsaxonicus TaxID=457575 RepID=A0A4Q7VZ57_9BURK|nr:DUF2905 domain-containing protein [Rivibacter subsaxonicus]RZU02067.1 DUF2905 family protein [Rivibacter subsaxonicus]